VAKRTLLIFACLLAAVGAAAFLAACGGGGDSTEAKGSGAVPEQPAGTGTEESGGKPKIQTEPREAKDTPADKKEIEAAIVASISEKDPANCTRIEAPGFVEQTTHQRGQAAITACEESAEAEAGEPARETVAVRSVEAVGESAVALAAISGGTLDGQTLEIALRKESGDWRLGRLIGFESFDPEAYMAAIGEVMTEQGGEVAAARPCVEQRLAKVPSEEFEKAILIGSAPLVQSAFENCQ
jgi:hypothetical protein